MLEFAVLGLLLSNPMHGYELRKRLSELLGPFRALSYGSLYPTLKKMRLAGLILETENTDSLVLRRAKRVYRITDAGIEQFNLKIAKVADTDYADDGFGVHLAFFAKTPSKARIRILEGRRNLMEQKREYLNNSILRTSASENKFSTELQQIKLEATEREISWITTLLAAEYQNINGPANSTKPTLGLTTEVSDDSSSITHKYKEINK